MHHDYKHYVDIIAEHDDHTKIEEFTEVMEHGLKKLEIHDEEAYRHIMYKLHCIAYGPHFSERLAKKAVAEMKNVNGTIGEHWTIEDTTKVMEQNAINANKCDWYYLMNMLHSDYSGLWGEDIAQYVKFGRAYINDPDADKGKVFHMWKAGRHH